jgi:hypothetical protein
MGDAATGAIAARIMEIMATVFLARAQSRRRKTFGICSMILLSAFVSVRANGQGDRTPEEIYAAQLAAAERKARVTAAQNLRDGDATILPNGDLVHYAVPSPPPRLRSVRNPYQAVSQIGQQNITSAQSSRRSFADDNFRLPSEKASGKAFLPAEEEVRQAKRAEMAAAERSDSLSSQLQGQAMHPTNLEPRDITLDNRSSQDWQIRSKPSQIESSQSSLKQDTSHDGHDQRSDWETRTKLSQIENAKRETRSTLSQIEQAQSFLRQDIARGTDDFHIKSDLSNLESRTQSLKNDYSQDWQMRGKLSELQSSQSILRQDISRGADDERIKNDLFHVEFQQRTLKDGLSY